MDVIIIIIYLLTSKLENLHIHDDFCKNTNEPMYAMSQKKLSVPMLIKTSATILKGNLPK
jgi:hypothetical protein